MVCFCTFSPSFLFLEGSGTFIFSSWIPEREEVSELSACSDCETAELVELFGHWRENGRWCCNGNTFWVTSCLTLALSFPSLGMVIALSFVVSVASNGDSSWLVLCSSFGTWRRFLILAFNSPSTLGYESFWKPGKQFRNNALTTYFHCFDFPGHRMLWTPHCNVFCCFVWWIFDFGICFHTDRSITRRGNRDWGSSGFVMVGSIFQLMFCGLLAQRAERRLVRFSDRLWETMQFWKSKFQINLTISSIRVHMFHLRSLTSFFQLWPDLTQIHVFTSGCMHFSICTGAHRVWKWQRVQWVVWDRSAQRRGSSAFIISIRALFPTLNSSHRIQIRIDPLSFWHGSTQSSYCFPDIFLSKRDNILLFAAFKLLRCVPCIAV